MGARGGSRGHLLFLLSVGILGWAAVVSLYLTTAPAPPAPLAALLFFVVIAGARLLAFPLRVQDGDAEVSLDSAIFIAAAACLGVPTAALGVAAWLSVDSLRRIRAAQRSRARDTACSRGDVLCLAAHTLYLGGLSGGLLGALARAFSVDTRPTAPRVALLGVAFLVSHYLVQTLQLRLGGRPFGAALKRTLGDALAEATLLPLALAIVLLWDRKHLLPFALLDATYLLVNWGFSRLARAARAMRRRAGELEALNRIGRALGTTLETSELVARLIEETQAALPDRPAVSVLLTQGGAMRRYLRGGRTEPADAAARRLLREKEPVREAGLMCVPLAIYGERIGAIMVESPRVSPRGLAPARRAPARDAFGAEDLSLLEAIASLAATALENARLYALANIDGLTGLYCRRYFDQRVAEEVERARRFGTTFALVLLDLDDFKQLNDTFGHVAGDRALREVAAIAASQLRGVDLAARYGGEELAFLLPRTSLIDAQPVAERIRDAVASHLFSENGEIRRITASIGVAGWAESGVDDPQSLVARADASLYRAKHAGKNRVEIDLVGFDIGPSLAPILRRRA